LAIAFLPNCSQLRTTFFWLYRRHHLAGIGEKAGNIFSAVGQLGNLIGGGRLGEFKSSFRGSIKTHGFYCSITSERLQARGSRLPCDLRHIRCAFRCIVFLKRMKKLLQLVAVLAIALLTAGPALAGLTCSMGTASALPCAPHCPMAMHHMGMDCQMPQASRMGCMQECCRFGWPQAVVRSAHGVKPKAAVSAIFVAVPFAATGATAAAAAPPPGDLVASSPPRHILFRVFRI
jgi:hypothetical protein